MRTRLIKGVLVLTAVSGFAGIPALAQARHGADDAVRGHHHRARGADDRRHHDTDRDRHGRGADDAPGDV